MEAEMTKTEMTKMKPASEQQPVPAASSQTHTASENWTLDMPQYVIDGKRGPSSKVTAAPTLDEIAAKKKADAKNAEKIKLQDAAAAKAAADVENSNGREVTTVE